MSTLVTDIDVELAQRVVTKAEAMKRTFRTLNGPLRSIGAVQQQVLKRLEQGAATVREISHAFIASGDEKAVHMLAGLHARELIERIGEGAEFRAVAKAVAA